MNEDKLSEKLTITRKELVAILTASTCVYVEKVFEIKREDSKDGIVKFNSDFVFGDIVDDFFKDATKKDLIPIPELVPEIGKKVHYQPKHYGDKFENGIIKSSSPKPKTVFVVYNCAGDWDNYQNYTGAATHLRDLKEGWKDEE